MTGPPVPEIPHPGAPPLPPVPPAHPPMPTTALDESLAQLRASRRLLMAGPIDDRTATRMCAELMLLDGQGAEPVELMVNSTGGPVAAATAVIDVLSLMRAPVTTCGIGTATGMAAVVLASGTGGRSATPRTTVSLRIDDRQAIDGPADDIARGADVLLQQLHHVAEHLATVSFLSVDAAAAALREGGPLTAAEALAAGLIDEVATR